MTRASVAETARARERAAAAPFQPGQKVRVSGCDRAGFVTYVDAYGAEIRYHIELPPTETRYGRDLVVSGRSLAVY